MLSKFKEHFAVPGKISRILKFVCLLAICCVFSIIQSDGMGEAAMKKEVLSSKTTLPGANEFNVIAEPFDWGKDVTRIMLNPGKTVSSSEVNAADFKVTAVHYSEQAYKNDFSGDRKVMDAYVVSEDGTKVDSGNYIIIELEYGSGVQGAHTGSYNYANYYTPLKLTYSVSWSAGSDTYAQHEVVNLVCDEFVLDRYTDSSIQDANRNFVDYAFYAPKADGGKHPLIIFFHGMGEGGAATLNNHGVQMYAYPECNFADTQIQNIMGGSAYVLLPQSPEKWPWPNEFKFTEESGYLDVVNSLIDSTIAANPDIDTDRIYVGGLSMGGYMASRVILNRPDKYAAAFLCSQAYAITEEDAKKLADLPIWISCSEADSTCRMDPYTYASYEKLVEAGTKEAKCAVMENNSSDPTSRFRFYSSDKPDYVLYEAVQEHENNIIGEFVWDNVSYAGHNGGWVPVFANGEYYLTDDGTKVSIMEWLASHSLMQGITVDASKAKTVFNAGETFTSEGIAVYSVSKDGIKSPVTGYEVVTPDMNKAGTAEVVVKYLGRTASYNITINAADQGSKTPVVDNPGKNTDKKVFKIAKTKLTIKKGKSAKIKVTVSPKTKVKFKSSKPKIAKVTKKGVVKALKKGNAKITVTAFGKKKVVKVKVK